MINLPPSFVSGNSKSLTTPPTSSGDLRQDPVQPNLIQSSPPRSQNQTSQLRLLEAHALIATQQRPTNSVAVIRKSFTAKENQDFSEKVFSEVSLAYQAGSGSDNIRGEGTEEQKRYIEAQTKLKVIRKRNRTNSIKGDSHITPFLKIDAANCGELAKISAQRVINQGGYAEVWGFSKADHQFTVVGKPPTGILGKDMSSWKGIWIIDAWSGTVTEATNYYEDFFSQMHKMTTEGKKIKLKDDEWVKPNDEIWLKPITERSQIVKSTPYLSNSNPWEYLSLSIDDYTS